MRLMGAVAMLSQFTVDLSTMQMRQLRFLFAKKHWTSALRRLWSKVTSSISAEATFWSTKEPRNQKLQRWCCILEIQTVEAMKMNEASKKCIFFMTRRASQIKGVDPEETNTSSHNQLAKIAFNVCIIFFLEWFVPLFNGQRLQDFWRIALNGNLKTWWLNIWWHNQSHDIRLTKAIL